jgi:anti-sigma factor (TIGR02949 family)
MLDEESSPEDNDFVLKHVEGCYQCYDNYNVEKEIRTAVKRRSRNLKIPGDVMKKIKMKIRAK